MKPFGEYLRYIRTSRGLLLREVAASMQIDPSFLSRIESGDKRVTREQVIKLAAILKQNENDLLIHYLRDRVVYELKDEKLAMKAIEAAEKKISYLNKGKGKRKV
jgi:transcriptional regulator with XRE-family HTH domain